jgi:hypothetical protein
VLKTTKIIIATTAVGVAALSLVTPAQAGNGSAVGAGLAGFGIGAIVGKRTHPTSGVRRSTAAACLLCATPAGCLLCSAAAGCLLCSAAACGGLRAIISVRPSPPLGQLGVGFGQAMFGALN